jgi:hypothetical protein
MGTGAITQYVDVAQLALYAFWVFFAILVYYLTVEGSGRGFLSNTIKRVKYGVLKALLECHRLKSLKPNLAVTSQYHGMSRLSDLPQSRQID